MKIKRKLNENNESVQEIEQVIEDTKPRYTKYFEYYYEVESETTFLLAISCSELEKFLYHTGQKPEKVAIEQIERWARKIGQHLPQFKDAIEEELMYDWYSGMNLDDESIVLEIEI